MRLHGRSKLAIAVLAALAPAAASPLEYVGHLGGDYARSEGWAGPTYLGASNHLAFDGDLGVGGFLEDPGFLYWLGKAGYNQSRLDYGQPTNTRQDTFLYGARLGLLQRREAAAHLLLSADRIRSDYSTDVQAVRSTGTATTDTYSVLAGTNVRGLPSTSAGYSYSDSVSTGFDRTEIRNTSNALGLAMNFGQPGLYSSLGYDLTWGTGTITPSNYMSHRVGLSASTSPGDSLGGHINVGYFLREPKTLSSANPRYDDTMVDLGLNLKSGDGLQYMYSHNSATDPSLQVHEIFVHTASATYGRRISTDWKLQGIASASLSQNRIGDAQSSGAGQSAGLTANFTRRAYGASLGAQVGMLEAAGASTALAYGVNASGNAAWNRWNRAFSVSYFANYGQNLGAEAGWTARQMLYADVTSGATDFLFWSARLAASSGRAGGGTFGDTAQRSIAAIGSLKYRKATFGLQIGTEDALTGPLANPLTDGLLIPAGYNTHARYAVASVAMPLAPSLSSNANAKYTVLSGPATPDQREADFWGSLDYAIGRWTFSLSDQYLTGGTTSFDRRTNRLLVRASMAFGSP